MSWKARLICVGRLKESFAKKGQAHYLERLAPHLRLDMAELKDGRGDGPARRESEGQAILEAVSGKDLVVLLDERGKDMASRKFAVSLRTWFEDPGRIPCFVIGGPFGVSGELRARADVLLRLGAMTWPHELVRVMFLEQLYRGVSILKNTPYHHD